MGTREPDTMVGRREGGAPVSGQDDRIRTRWDGTHKPTCTHAKMRVHRGAAQKTLENRGTGGRCLRPRTGRRNEEHGHVTETVTRKGGRLREVRRAATRQDASRRAALKGTRERAKSSIACARDLVWRSEAKRATGRTMAVRVE